MEVRTKEPGSGVRARFGARDPEELERLRARLLAAVRRRCPAWLATEAEDIVQTVMMRILDQNRRSGGSVTFGASYLEKAAQRALIDVVRARFRRRETGLAEEEDGTMSVPDPRSPDAVDRLDLSEGLRACLSHLIEPRRIAVATRLLGHSVPDAARLLGWTTKKVEHLVGRGIGDLRDCLRRKGIEP
jgi:RNA polymerase sigma-70 factor (ECF subfamily)